jgi:hypothetical protein
MTEPVEQLQLLLAVPANGMIGRQVSDQLADAGSELIGEVGGRRPDEGVDVVDRRLGHVAKANGVARESRVRFYADPRPGNL